MLSGWQWVALAVSAAGMISCRGGGGEGSQAQRGHVARIVSVGGAVDLLHTGAVDWVRARGAEDLYEDDRVRTFKTAWAQLGFDEGSSLRVDEESLITLG